jgi:colanic acid/amylovoran biosynthesis glycosyltransferase
MEGRAMSGAPRVLYVLSRFPCYDEAFLLREIHAVAERLETWIFSLRPSRDPVVHDEARALAARTLSMAFLFSPRIVRAHLHLVRRRPRRYAVALLRLLAGNWRSPEFLLKNLALFPKAGWLAVWAMENGVTHLHAGWATYPAAVALLVSDITGLPFSFSGHAHDIYLDTTQLAEKVRRAAFVTTCTASNAAYLRALVPGRAADNIAVVRHGIRLSRFDRAPEAEGPIRILSVGTLHPHKGFAHLLDALEGLADDGCDFRCTIVGGGPLEADLRRRAARAGLTGRVTMTGALAQADVLLHYARTSVFVLMAQPEWHWGVPNVIVEALASGNAVVTTRFGSVEELIEDGVTGLLVPPRDPAALAAAIRRLDGDEALRRRLAAAGRAIVAREYDLDRAVDWYVSRFRGERA